MIFGIGRRAETAPEGQNPEEFKVQPETRNLKSVDVRQLILLSGFMTILGSGVENVSASPEAGRAFLQSREAIASTVYGKIASMLPRLVKPDGSVDSAKVEPGKSLNQFSQEMGPRDNARAIKSFNTDADNIKSIIVDQDTENRLLIIMATLGKVGATALLQKANDGVYESNIYGPIETVGDLQEMLSSGAGEGWKLAYDSLKGDKERAASVTNSLIDGATSICKDGDPDKLTDILKVKIVSSK